MKRYPYIGITDFETPEQVRRMLNAIKDAQHKYNPISFRRLMVGTMMSYKTLNGIPSKCSSVWVPKEKIKDLFMIDGHAYNTLHYADYTENTKAEDLIAAAGFGGANMHAIQLDMIWPSIEDISELKKGYPSVDVILQINTPAFKQVGNDPTSLVERLREYGNFVDFVLLDKSMGTGREIDVQWIAPFIEAITESGLPTGIAVAGGLGPSTLHLIRDLVKRFPFLSIDAQGRLRLSGSALDPIDWNMAMSYIYGAVRMFR